jgi:multiple sugar transport system substrate-binding protein
VRVRAVILAVALALAPAAARAASDLVVWWEEGFYPGEDQAVREIVAAFEQRTGKRVELAFPSHDDIEAMTQAALDAGRPPDFVYTILDELYDRWAHEGRLADLTDGLGPLAAQFDPDALARANLLDATTGQRSLYALPVGFSTLYLHAWTSLLEQAGLTLADIPREWEAFWSFWCDRVQPAVRKATGREDVWGVGLPMSVEAAVDTEVGFWQFVAAYEADYVTHDGRLIIDEPFVRNRLAKALESYTAIHRKGCTPPAAEGWRDIDNNKAFLAQAVVMTANRTLSIPGALRADRPEDYHHNTATIDWPEGAYGQPLAIKTSIFRATVFRDGAHVATATEFVRFLVGEGWLGHWLNFAGDRYLPPLTSLLQQPFWLDPGDRHRMAAAMQFLTHLRDYDYAVVSGDWRHSKVDQEQVWAKAIHRIVTDGLTPEQAGDEAIARIKQLLSE